MQGKLILQGAIMAAAIVCTWSNRAPILDAGTVLALPKIGGAPAAVDTASNGAAVVYRLKSGARVCVSRTDPRPPCYWMVAGTVVDVMHERDGWANVRAGFHAGWVPTSKIKKGAQ